MLLKLNVEYDVVVDSNDIPDKAVLDAIVATPFEITLKSPEGKMFKVTLNPCLAYPSSFST